MARDDINSSLAALIPIISDRLKRANSIASAASTLVASGDEDGAFRVLLDSEDSARDAITLLDAVCILHRETRD